ncbi:MAG TPA: hypothetical protein VH502_11735, partial [Actinoplanes sp.]
MPVEQRTGTDARMRPVVLESGMIRSAAGRQAQAARGVLGVAIATVLAAGAIAAGSWSIVTAAQGSTPPDQPSPLWYPTPQPPAPSTPPR